MPEERLRGTRWRLLTHGPSDGAWNMAVDEAILDRYAMADTPLAPTLRLYSWEPPALSLGRGQRAAVSHDAAFLSEQGIELVRRPTGGGAVLHEHERTYAIAGRLREDPFAAGVVETYGRIAEALVRGLRRLGLPARVVEGAGRRASVSPALCFAQAVQNEIDVDGRKVIGSAQVRRRGAFLQHGSILIRADVERAEHAVGVGPGGASGRFAGIEDLLGRAVGVQALDDAVVAGIEEVFQTECRPGVLCVEETISARRLLCEKYQNREWTLDGRENTGRGCSGIGEGAT